MRIDRLTLKNYRGFAQCPLELNPRFNLFVGDNATGKTSVLDAMVVAMDSWFIGMKVGVPSGGIGGDDVRVVPHSYGDSISFEKQFPSVVEAVGCVMGQTVFWSRELNREGGRTTRVGAQALTTLASEAERRVREGQFIDLPLICSYGTERLWWESRHYKPKNGSSKSQPSRFDGYRDCTAFQIQETDLLDWIRAEVSVSQQKGSETTALLVMKQALTDCVDDAQTIYYDERIKDLIVVMNRQGPQMFSNLSDGQRIMLTLIGDLTRRAIALNPHLGRDVLNQIVGIVTIDELDLHLHPKWQRHVIHDLKRTFPKIQFVVTTHSPQLIGEALPEEIRILEDGEVSSPQRSFGVDSSRILEEVMHASPRNIEVKDHLLSMARLIDKEDFEGAKGTLRLIEANLGENDPEVTGANTLINLLESTR